MIYFQVEVAKVCLQLWQFTLILKSTGAVILEAYMLMFLQIHVESLLFFFNMGRLPIYPCVSWGHYKNPQFNLLAFCKPRRGGSEAIDYNL